MAGPGRHHEYCRSARLEGRWSRESAAELGYAVPPPERWQHKTIHLSAAYSGASEVVEVGVQEVPTEVVAKLAYEYGELGTKQAWKRETELTDRFEQFLKDRKHRVARYKITTPGSSGSQFTDLADGDTKVLYEAKGVTNRMSVRLALGQILDYGRYVKERVPETVLALLLPSRPPGDMIQLLEAHQIGCVVETQPGAFVDVTNLRRCPS